MSDNLNENLILLGAGQMARDYASVLEALGVGYNVIGRGEESGAAFEKKFDKRVRRGGLARWLDIIPTPGCALVAVSVDQLAEVAISLMKKGVPRILLEKPAGLDGDQIRRVAIEAGKRDAEVSVGYNRRFYSSTLRAEEIIAEDGQITSFCFEFTEWSHKIEQLDLSSEVKKNWFLANSTHVMDLAFYLCGRPETISCYKAGSLEWHPDGSIYTGAGVTTGGALFSYCADWESPGRWGLEVLTGKHRLIFRPMEKLQVQRKGSIETEYVDIDDHLDRTQKPGLFLQTRSFLEGGSERLCSIEDHLINLDIYEKMSGKDPAQNKIRTPIKHSHTISSSSVEKKE